MKKVFIGIDPAFRKDGFAAAIEDEDRTVSFRIFPTFLHFLRWMDSEDAPAEAVCFVENSNMQDITFGKYTHHKMGKAQIEKISRGIGKNMAASQYTVDACRYRYGEKNVVEISPEQKGAKWTKHGGLTMGRNILRMRLQQAGVQLVGKKLTKLTKDEIDSYQILVVGRNMYNLKGKR